MPKSALVWECFIRPDTAEAIFVECRRNLRMGNLQNRSIYGHLGLLHY